MNILGIGKAAFVRETEGNEVLQVDVASKSAQAFRGRFSRLLLISAQTLFGTFPNIKPRGHVLAFSARPPPAPPKEQAVVGRLSRTVVELKGEEREQKHCGIGDHEHPGR